MVDDGFDITDHGCGSHISLSYPPPSQPLPSLFLLSSHRPSKIAQSKAQLTNAFPHSSIQRPSDPSHRTNRIHIVHAAEILEYQPRLCQLRLALVPRVEAAASPRAEEETPATAAV